MHGPCASFPRCSSTMQYHIAKRNLAALPIPENHGACGKASRPSPLTTADLGGCVFYYFSWGLLQPS